MKIIDGWKTVLARAWTSRIILITNMLLIAPAILPFFGMLPDETRDILPNWVFTKLPVALLSMALVARVIEQPKLKAKLANKAIEKQAELSVEEKAKRLEDRKARRLAAAEKLIAEAQAARAAQLVEDIARG